jgi:hypothetical protein
MDALQTQIGGDHYKSLKMQPMELAYLIGGSPCFMNVTKYITRNKGDRLENLQKAYHCIQLESQLRSTPIGFDFRELEYNTEEKELVVLTPKDIYGAYIAPLSMSAVPNAITEFAQQFDNGDLYERILTSMYVGDYVQAADLLELLMERHLQTKH